MKLAIPLRAQTVAMTDSQTLPDVSLSFRTTDPADPRKARGRNRARHEMRSNIKGAAGVVRYDVSQSLPQGSLTQL
ncbi:hypothetical protein M673_00935 [Aureimonas sp. AU20]|nr:hypothetical protein M673_00935 [Aureimonas sp. AU20]